MPNYNLHREGMQYQCLAEPITPYRRKSTSIIMLLDQSFNRLGEV
jgi:hypothetical protein